MAIEITGNWQKGYALDLHTQSSEYLGVDETGRDRFDTVRTEIGALVYKLKYRADTSVVPQLVDFILRIKRFEKMNCIVPAPPSDTTRRVQPVFIVGQELSKKTGIPFTRDAILKIKDTPQLKQITDPTEREKILADAFKFNNKYNFTGLNVLIIDDLFRSGSTLKAITSVLYNQAKVSNVYVVTLTKTRSLR